MEGHGQLLSTFGVLVLWGTLSWAAKHVKDNRNPESNSWPRRRSASVTTDR
jgi:hypothetical protein